MRVFDLRCDAGHGFEGWFASEADYLAQDGAGRVECPLCGVRGVQRLPSAPRLNLGAQPPAATTPPTKDTQRQATAGQPIAPPGDAAAARWLRAVRHTLAHTEDVGDRFPEEARRIHYGEAAERGIRGRATLAEARALHEEGIEIVPLALPPAAKDTLQ